MKRSLIPLLLAALLFSVNTKAQTNANCNADFTFSVSGNSVVFYAADNADSALVKHYWNFGDGSATVVGQFVTISTGYSLPGTYTVTHTVKRITSNGVVACEKSVSKNIVIEPVPTPCELGAGFNFKRDDVQTNKIYFTNTTTPSSAVTNYKWNFGDGTYSDAINPAHVFTASGLYTVCLEVKRGDNCYDDTCSYVQVQVPGTDPCNLTVSFLAAPDSTVFNKIHFTGLIAPISSSDSIQWSFGDGAYSDDINPSHVYNVPGVYRVCLVVKRKYTATGTPPCVREYCHEIIVKAPCNLKADFTVAKDSLTANPLNTYKFTNTSAGEYDSTFWNFGDGTPMVINVNDPIHIYTGPGTYTVCLIVKQKAINSAGTPCAAYSCKTIVVGEVTPPCNFIAYFAWKADSSDHKKIHFTNYSQPVVTTAHALWSFGDGKVGDSWNSDHVYEKGGTYIVCLRIKQNDTCVKEFCKTIIVDSVSEPCNLAVKFAAHIDSFNLKKIHFYNLSGPVSSTDSVRWTFGDGSASNDFNPVHTYNVPGIYTVCLRVARLNTTGIVPCVKEYCQTITVNDSCRLKADFIFWKDSTGLALSAYHFKNISEPIADADSVYWDFGDGSPVVINHNDPVHVYANPGTYVVCLTVYKQSNVADLGYCKKQICKTIVVANPQPCNLQAAFEWKADPAQPNKVFFVNQSQPANTTLYSQWSFGDGVSEVSWNADHVYPHSGIYIVCLKIKQSNTCQLELCKEIKIDSLIHDSCRLQVGFTHTTSNQ